MKANFNDEIIVYPSREGWNKIKRWAESTFGGDYESSLNLYMTEDNGFRITLWQFAHLFHDMLYHGTKNFETMGFKIKKK